LCSPARFSGSPKGAGKMTRNVDQQQNGKNRNRSNKRAQPSPVSDGELRRFEPVSDSLVLAAVDRAERHRQREREGVMMSDIAEHLGFVHGSWTSRRLRPQLEALIEAGLLRRSRRHGVVVWELTSGGRRRLTRSYGAGEVGVLSEAPQHRTWRHARAKASEHIDRFRDEVRRTLGEAGRLLDTEARSDAWFDIDERLQTACQQLGSATYCLREWREPDDARPDIDDRSEPEDDTLGPDERGRTRWLRSGRRSVWRWPDAALPD
jgi:hypothetical protein